jgi:ATP-dependent helicase YprA (DUF1998 family)
MSTDTEAVKMLDKARFEAVQANKYDSEATWQELKTRFEQVFDRKLPYDWQLDVVEALLLHINCIVIAGTGAGKTMPFGMPLLLDKMDKKMVLAISPLNELEFEQVRPIPSDLSILYWYMSRQSVSNRWASQQQPSTVMITLPSSMQCNGCNTFFQHFWQFYSRKSNRTSTESS